MEQKTSHFRESTEITLSLSPTLTIFALPLFSQSSLSNCSFLRMTQMSSEQFESTFVGERCGEIWGDFRLLCSCSTSPHLISELKPKRESLHSLLF